MGELGPMHAGRMAREVCSDASTGQTTTRKWDFLWDFPCQNTGLFSSVPQSCLTLWDPMDCSTPGLSVLHRLPVLDQTHVSWLGDAIQTCHPLLLPPSIFPSIRAFSNESVLWIRWPKYWSFNFSISPSNEYSGLISFLDWLVGSPCSPRDSQEASPTPQFKGINSSVLSFLYNPPLTSILDTGMGGVGFHFLLQGTLQGSNRSLLHCR